MTFSGLASKPVATVVSVVVSKLVTTVSLTLASKPVMDFLVEPQNQGGEGFFGLVLKTGSYGLVICASKLSRQFLGLCIKIKQATVYRLRHQTDRRATAWDMRRDLTACFVWKQAGLGFSVWPQDWQRCEGGWYTWHHRGGCVESILKMDGSCDGPRRTRLPLLCRFLCIRP
jgi:hypothetical protein